MENRYCPECGVTCGGKFCWRCGKRAVNAIMVCPNCEGRVSIVGKFCGECGRPIQEEIKEHIQRERGGEKSGDEV